MAKRKIAMLTAGGLAPCLSAAVGDLIAEYTRKSPKAEIIRCVTVSHSLLPRSRPTVNSGSAGLGADMKRETGDGGRGTGVGKRVPDRAALQ